MNEEYVDIPIEMEPELYFRITGQLKPFGITIEDYTLASIQFAVNPANRSLLHTAWGKANPPVSQEEQKRAEIKMNRAILEIALQNTKQEE